MRARIEARAGADRRHWAGFAFVAIATAVLALVFVRGDRHAGGAIAAGARKPMPSLELTQLDGGVWRLANHHGQVVVINYWASWCVPCWEETPALIRLSAEMGSKDLAIVGVAMDEGSPDYVDSNVRTFVQKLHVSYPIALPVPMSQTAYGMKGLPTTILVDRRGQVAKTYLGAVREAELRDDVRMLLKETAD